MAGSTFLEGEISAVQDRCVFRRSLDGVWIKSHAWQNGCWGQLTLRLLSRRRSSGPAPAPELVVLSSEPHIHPWGLKEGDLDLDILGDIRSLSAILSLLSPWLPPYTSSSSWCRPCSLGWLWSSVLLLSGTPTCPGRHIGSKSASLHHFYLVVMHLDPGRATSSSDHLLKVGTLVFTGFSGWSELNGISTLKWPISL